MRRAVAVVGIFVLVGIIADHGRAGAIVASQHKSPIAGAAGRESNARRVHQPSYRTPPASASVSQPPGVLSAVSCTSATSCTAVGSFGLHPLVESWNGKLWRSEPVRLPPGASTGAFRGISCASGRTCVAVGNYFRKGVVGPLVEEWNGKTWHVEPTPNPANTQAGAYEGSTLYGISCESKACMAVGSYVQRATYKNFAFVEAWNGKSWNLGHTPYPAHSYASAFSSVSCTGEKSCTAAGYDNASTFAEVWNGKTWKVQRTPNPVGGYTSGFSSISCISSICVAVATGGSSGTGPHAFADVWEKKVWRLESTPKPTGSRISSLDSVSCVSAERCTVAAGFETRSYQLELSAESWNGKVWRMETAPSPSGATSPFFAAISCVSASACMAVGSYRKGSQVPLSEAWNGKVWKLERTVE